MDTKGYQQRLRLFTFWNSHISLYEPSKKDVFWCPICLTPFGPCAIEGDNPDVDLAHVISKKLGGKFCTLTCNQCNGGAGARLEAFLLKRFSAEDAMAGVGTTPARILGNFGDVGVEFGYAPDRKSLSLYVKKEQSSDDAIKNLQALAGGFTKPVHIYFPSRPLSTKLNPKKIPHPNDDHRFLLLPWHHDRPRRVEVAIYQSAFLAMFSHFGYEFVFQRQFKSLRDQLLCPDEVIWKSKMLVPAEDTASFFLENRKHCVVFVRQPVRAILVFLRMKPKEGRQRDLAVLLPGLEDPANLDIDLKAFEGTLIPYSKEALVTLKFYFQHIWQEVQGTAASDGNVS